MERYAEMIDSFQRDQQSSNSFAYPEGKTSTASEESVLASRGESLDMGLRAVHFDFYQRTIATRKCPVRLFQT